MWAGRKFAMGMKMVNVTILNFTPNFIAGALAPIWPGCQSKNNCQYFTGAIRCG